MVFFFETELFAKGTVQIEAVIPPFVWSGIIRDWRNLREVGLIELTDDFQTVSKAVIPVMSYDVVIDDGRHHNLTVGKSGGLYIRAGRT